MDSTLHLPRASSGESVTRGFVQLYARGFGKMVELKRGLWNCVEI